MLKLIFNIKKEKVDLQKMHLSIKYSLILEENRFWFIESCDFLFNLTFLRERQNPKKKKKPFEVDRLFDF